MKPRNKLERSIVAMADSLPPLTEQQRDFAKGLFPAEALYYSRRGNNCEFYCQCCGAMVPTIGKWIMEEHDTDTWTCPVCGAQCKVLPQYSGGWNHNYDRRTGAFSQSPTTARYVTLADTHEGYQVFRTFEVHRWNGRSDTGGVHRGCPTEFYFREIYQNWIDEKGRETIVSRPYTRGFNHHSWSYRGPWGIGRHNAHCSGYYQFDDVFTLDGHWWFPGSRITQRLRRNGFTGRLLRGTEAKADMAKLAICVLTDNRFEELVKTGQGQLAAYLIDNGRHDLKTYLRTIRVATRHGYRIKEPDLWLDYIDDIRFLHLDDRNPHYICPVDIKDAHAAMQRRRDREEERIKFESRVKQAEKYEAQYAKDKARYFGIAFGDDTVQVVVLQTVKEVLAEGCAMHHCVFNNGYYKEKNSVLLSARDAAGNRLETVEVNISPLRVAQIRGLQNQPTKLHNHIVALVEANLDLFRRAAKRKAV